PRTAPVVLPTITPTPVIHTLSLHDALPISAIRGCVRRPQSGGLPISSSPNPAPRSTSCSPAAAGRPAPPWAGRPAAAGEQLVERSEEHTSELQSLAYLVCRLLLEKKKKSLT